MSAIEVKDISKSFTLAHEEKERYTALRDVVAKKTKKIFSFAKPFRQHISKEEFWALKDVSFNVAQGERVGIIGRNGAGKSTLLKILSRITDPTKGRIKLSGRVASLLEVGTGFHPELTGRENIFLNGAILGMSRAEIKRHFDAIVDFAEIEKFLDTPVKRYSSGMYVRLAFAVAAHLEPEILIIDEVLAVGDAQFQKKCLGKMEDVSKKDGRTILFVSHNMAAIKTLCSSAVVLHKGQKMFEGDVQESLSYYLGFEQEQAEDTNTFTREKVSGKKIYLQHVQFIDDLDADEFCLQLKMKIQSAIDARISVNIHLKDAMGFPVAYGCTHYSIPELFQLHEGCNELLIKSKPIKLAVGKYKMGIVLVYPGVEELDKADDCIQFEISNEVAGKRHYGVSQDWGFGSVEISFDK